jgi:3-oxoacyl-[acyl-carrier-protein] synthase III
MLFQNVAVAGLAHVDAPHRVTSAELEDRLAPTFERLGIRLDVLRTLAGIEARRWWDEGVQPSDAATMAAEKLLGEVDVPRDRIGVLVNTSVCRDFVEPSTACLVHGNLGLAPTCLNFDIGNACLAFLNAMELVGSLIERGAVDYGLIVDGEGSRYIQQVTIERMLQPEMDERSFRKQFATLTLGSGGVAMLLTRRDLAPDGAVFRGGVMRSATQHSRLCWGQNHHMETDTKKLLFAGVELALETWKTAQEALGWKASELDELVMHQVSAVHTSTLCQTLGLDMKKALLTFPELGNVGPASVPITLSKAVEAGRVTKGDRVALMGIGSGLNCAMFELVW